MAARFPRNVLPSVYLFLCWWETHDINAVSLVLPANASPRLPSCGWHEQTLLQDSTVCRVEQANERFAVAQDLGERSWARRLSVFDFPYQIILLGTPNRDQVAVCRAH